MTLAKTMLISLPVLTQCLDEYGMKPSNNENVVIGIGLQMPFIPECGWFANNFHEWLNHDEN